MYRRKFPPPCLGSRQIICNDTSTLLDHFCRLPEKGRRDSSRGDEGEGQRVKRNRNERKETKEIKNIPPPPLPERVDRGGGDTGIRGAGDGGKRGEEWG